MRNVAMRSGTHAPARLAQPVEVAASTVPVLGGGRIRAPEEGWQCPDLGGFAVVVGTAIHTRQASSGVS